MSSHPDLLQTLADCARWAGQVSEHGGVPNRVREAAKGVEARGNEARAAVAELMEADAEYDAAQAAFMVPCRTARETFDRWEEAKSRRRYALARCGGAK